ncbi:MAG: nucleotide exchange factor GrpE [Candidatus Moraniibacteriota bacterium]|jgi:molecular chaperone GrpE
MTQEKITNQKQLFRLSQKVLFFDEDKNQFLIMKASKIKDDIEAHKEWFKKYGPWDLPGGHVEIGETDFTISMDREIKEESEINLENLGRELCGIEFMANSKNPNTGITTIYLVKYAGAVILSEEHEEYKWLSAEEILEMKDVKSWIKDAVQKAVEKLESQSSVDSWHRCMADFDNYKKRQTENQKEFTKYAAEGVINDMLPVLDNFHAATGHIPEGESDNPWVTGIMFIQQQMEKVFEEHNVTRIEIKVGDEFDPLTMEAVKHDDEEELSEDPKVEKVAQPGYKIGEKVLRPARVVLK